MHLQRRLALLELSSARPAAPEPLELRGDFSGTISQLGHFSRAAAASPRSAAAPRPGVPPRSPPRAFPTATAEERRPLPSGHLCPHFEVPTLSGYAALRPAAWPCCPQRRQEREQEGAARLYRSCHLLGYCKERGRGGQGASASGPCQQGLANSETSLHEVDQGHPNPSTV